MALTAVISAEDHGQLPDPIKAEYKEHDDGTFILDVTPANNFELTDPTPLRSALSKERENARKAQSRLEAFGDLEPDAARDALAQLEKLKDSDPDKMAEELAASKVKQITDKHATEMESVQSTIKTLTAQLEKALITDAATKALSEAEGSIELLLPHVERQTRLRRLDDGRHVVEVVDANGDVRISQKQGSTDPMTISELVEIMREDSKFAPAFKGTGASGTGASGGTGAAKSTMANAALLKMPPAERLKQLRRDGVTRRGT